MNNFASDIPLDTAQAAYHGVSWHPERRAESTRNEYAAELAQDRAALTELATKHNTLDLLPAEFERYRAGYRKRTLAYLHSSARCVSSWIAGPSNFPARRMNKRADITHKRLNELIEFRRRALKAIRRTLTPGLQPIRASDGDAIDRLESKIAQAEGWQARMRTANAAIRRHKKEGEQAQIAGLLALGFSESIARKLLQPDFCNRIGFPDYELTNNGANIRRMKQRLEQISAAQSTPDTAAESANGIRLEDCPADNRVRLFFPGKPDEATRTDLKRSGFRWSPTLGCWQAYRNWSAQQTAQRFAGTLTPVNGITIAT
jgi:hypothetical protein